MIMLFRPMSSPYNTADVPHSDIRRVSEVQARRKSIADFDNNVTGE